MAQRIQPGDILSIPLLDGRFAFCRVLKDTSIGVYGIVSDSPQDMPRPELPYRFTVPVYPDLLTSGEWVRVLRLPFINDENAWPPPYYVRDVISGKLSIYHKGKMRPSTARECSGLEKASVWDKEDVLQRICPPG